MVEVYIFPPIVGEDDVILGSVELAWRDNAGISSM